jgi:hypothetical protein
VICLTQSKADDSILIPVIVEDILLPMGFRRIQAVDLINEIENKMPHLLETPEEQWVELNARKRCP